MPRGPINRRGVRVEKSMARAEIAQYLCVAAWLKDVRIQQTNPPPMRWSLFRTVSIANFGFTPIAFTTKRSCEQRLTSEHEQPKLPLPLSLVLVVRRLDTESFSLALTPSESPPSIRRQIPPLRGEDDVEADWAFRGYTNLLEGATQGQQPIKPLSGE